MTPDDVRRLLSAEPDRTALLFDFDGTLSPIVDDPAAAAAAPGAIDLLERLAGRYPKVAAISGRPRSFIADQLPASVDLSGLYGLELRSDGVERDHADAEPWRAVVADAVTDAERSLPSGVVVEPKGLSLTVHFRQQPTAEDEVRAWAERTAKRTQLEVRSAKASFELHPPIEVDKGTSVVELAAGCTTVAYCGDDVGDLPAFAALERLRAGGRTTVAIAVGGAELPDAVAAAADLVVDDPAALVALLEPLAASR